MLQSNTKTGYLSEEAVSTQLARIPHVGVPKELAARGQYYLYDG